MSHLPEFNRLCDLKGMLRMNRIIVFIISVMMFIVALFTGCSSVDGTKWTLTGWLVSSVGAGDYTMSLEFDKETFSGRSAVNSYGGDYIILPGGKITISGMYATEMAGSPEAMQAESVYFGLFDSVEKYVINDNVLTLFDANGNEVLIFEKTD